ncbi:MAG: tryptophan-rich sensory protein [Firmicutes bacterium HGW-Firmicutes-16]|nr:MAG: tryptophan-rich sensory protein [Firmicutes bacterium HGW-Firmicutes-16]
MIFKKLRPYIISILIALAVGVLSGIATNSGMPIYERLIKPPLTPPSAVFPIVWPILYILMGIGAAIIWESTDKKCGTALSIYAFQLVFNAIWSVLFFGFEAYLLSFIWLILLWLLIIMMIISFYRIRPIAGLLQIPYLLWVTFAGYLNFMIWQLNR